MINVGIIEDHSDELKGFLRDLSREKDIHVVATAKSAAEARTAIVSAQPHVVIVDLVLPDCAGAALIVELRAALPDSEFLVLSAYEDYDRIYSAILAGAVGYLGKVYLKGGLAAAVRDVHAGGSPMSSPIARKVIQAFHVTSKATMNIGRLSDREQQILHILATGRSYREIAEALFISVETVRTHVRNIYRKLQIHTWTQINQSHLYDSGQRRS
jgi:DNA-binding NarL/FixJ family response regulator